MQPGWYGDPFSRAGLRWWDGNAWTSHTSAAHQPSQPAYPQRPMFDPSRDLADEQRAAGRAVYGLLLLVGYTVVSYLVTAAVSGGILRDAVRRFRDETAIDANGTYHYHVTFNVPTLWLNGFSLLSFCAQILFWIWLYRAATVARRAGLPARREPFWAWLGFIVPVVNFWFPYQVAADALPAGHPARAVVKRWWAFWIAQTLAPIPIVAIAYLSTPAAIVLAVAACALPVLSAVNARLMIAETTAAHRHALGLVA